MLWLAWSIGGLQPKRTRGKPQGYEKDITITDIDVFEDEYFLASCRYVEGNALRANFFGASRGLAVERAMATKSRLGGVAIERLASRTVSNLGFVGKPEFEGGTTERDTNERAARSATWSRTVGATNVETPRS